MRLHGNPQAMLRQQPFADISGKAAGFRAEHQVVAILVAHFVVMGAAFGGGNSQGVFGASGATSLLGKLTYAAAAVWMVTCISLFRRRVT